LTPDLQILYVIAAGVFGLLIGSFSNVCIYRIPRDISIVRPRSFCPHCEQQIAWYDNVPLLSYGILRGRCRGCQHAIGIRYPLVELTTAVLFIGIAVSYGWSLAALKWALFETIVVVLFWTDLEQRILPDELTLGGAVLGVVFALFVTVPGTFGELLLTGAKMSWQSLCNSVLGALILAGPIWLLGIAYAWVRKREGLGLGDVKLLVMLGVFLGIEKGLLALMIGAIGGSILGVSYMWLTRKAMATYELPFGSFLCAGAAVVPLFGPR
jgi:leader peptidase (prepilin peptidase)/N-methyltransferase